MHTWVRHSLRIVPRSHSSLDSASCAHRQPIICLRKLAVLSNTSSSELNWVKQLKNLLLSIQEDVMLDRLEAKYWISKRDNSLSKFRAHMHKLDRDRYFSSTACQFKFISPFPESRIQRIPLHFLKPLLQLRLASKYACHITVDSITDTLSPKKTCPYCQLDALETAIHFICDCPCFTNSRLKYLKGWIIHEYPRELMLSLLKDSSLNSVRKLEGYCRESHKLKTNILP